LSLPLILKNSDSLLVLELLINPWVLLFIAVLSAYILNAEIPLFALKIKKLNFKDNGLPLFFLTISLLLLVLLKFAGVALIIVFYVLLSLITNKFKSNKS
jgi:CDP-diacylglycerol--serine O-phosphatidyltransferase